MTSLSISANLHVLGDPGSVSITTSNAPFADLELPVSEIHPRGRDPLEGGSHSDIYQADWTQDGVSILVALKVLRRNGKTQKKVNECFRQEVGCWRILDHKNIAPVFGVCSNWPNSSPVIILPWYDNGTASQYLKRNPNVDPMPIIMGIADGLAYTHNKTIVHGDLRGANVMIDEHGHARLIDFGLAHFMTPHADVDVDVDPPEGFSINWCAPELLESSVSTVSSDVYAFASTAYELLSGHIPYHTLRESVVVGEIMKGTLPACVLDDFLSLPRVCGLGDAEVLWAVLQSCWAAAARRPSISEVRLSLMRWIS